MPHYWRVEQDSGAVHVFAYNLVGTAYQLIADSADRPLELTTPFEMILPIDAITP